MNLVDRSAIHDNRLVVDHAVTIPSHTFSTL